MGVAIKPTLADAADEFHRRFPKGQFIGLAPLFGGTTIVPAGASDWIIVPSGEDPQIKLNSLHAPKKAKRALQQLARSNARVAALYVAHEVRPGAEQRLKSISLAEELRTDPRQHNQLLAHRLDKVGRAVTGVVSTIAIAGALAAAAPLAALGALAGGLDPAVFAAVTATGEPRVGELAAFFHIVSWI